MIKSRKNNKCEIAGEGVPNSYWKLTQSLSNTVKMLFFPVQTYKLKCPTKKGPGHDVTIRLLIQRDLRTRELLKESSQLKVNFNQGLSID